MSTNNTIINELSQQYLATLKMIEELIIKCKDELWQDYSHPVVISQLVYHIISSADYFLLKTNNERNSFKPKYGNSGFIFNDPAKNFSKRQLLDHLAEVQEKATKLFSNLTVEELTGEPMYEATDSFSLFGSLMFNLRHLMNHIGALRARLTLLGNEPLPYVNAIYGDERDTWVDMDDQGVTLIQQGKLDEAEKIYLDICANSNIPIYHYNLACVYSRKGNREKALDSLKVCLKFDKRAVFRELVKTDSDLENIRYLPTFQQLMS